LGPREKAPFMQCVEQDYLREGRRSTARREEAPTVSEITRAGVWVDSHVVEKKEEIRKTASEQLGRTGGGKKSRKRLSTEGRIERYATRKVMTAYCKNFFTGEGISSATIKGRAQRLIGRPGKSASRCPKQRGRSITGDGGKNRQGRLAQKAKRDDRCNVKRRLGSQQKRSGSEMFVLPGKAMDSPTGTGGVVGTLEIATKKGGTRFGGKREASGTTCCKDRKVI